VSGPARHADARLARVIDFYETLDPASLPRLPEVYGSDARFKDPFNDVQGIAAIQRVFEHMFSSLESPRFVVRTAVIEGDDAFLTWDFGFRLRRPGRSDALSIHGATHLSFGADGRVALHRDYWDAAEELYERLPVLGLLMRWLRRRASGGGSTQR
jgi:steroid Delta-isomerase